MDCFHPASVPRPNGRGPADRITIPCGKCIPCQKRYQSEWTFRLLEQQKCSGNSNFLTLTYDDNHLPWTEDQTNWDLCKSDLTLFLKRLRQDQFRWYKRMSQAKKIDFAQYQANRIKYYAVGEYGEKTLRPHYHLLIFNLPRYNSYDQLELEIYIQKIWKNGRVHSGTVTEKSIQYVTGYILKKSHYREGQTPPFSHISNGLGKSYLIHTDYHKKNKLFYSVNQDGKKVLLPRYLRDRIFSKEEIEANNEKVLDARLDRYVKEYNDITDRGYDYTDYKTQIMNQAKENIKKRGFL